MKILVYEDAGYKNIYPLNLFRATYDVKCGANTILQRISSFIKDKFGISLHCRNYLAPYLRELHDYKINSVSKDDHLLLNGRVIFSEASVKYLLSEKTKNSYYTFNNEIVAANISKERFSLLKEKTESKENVFDREFFESNELKNISLKEDFEIKVINYSWDLVDNLIHGGLEDDMNYFLSSKENKRLRKIKNSDHFVNHKNILISKDANIMPEVVLDASDGRIVIDEGVRIEPFTFIKGPVYIGKNCLVKSGAKIYGPCVIGKYSKVAGEIAESIFHSYVNKQHDGFIGHSYICPFVNLGADTVTSDLKNNYSMINVNLNEELVDTGMQFLGSMIGDHSKTSINTMLNTGSMVGIFANIFGGGFPLKETGSFTWNEAGKESKNYDIDKALETAKIVMERRGVNVSEVYMDLVRSYSKDYH